jgi:hypothetical protein
MALASGFGAGVATYMPSKMNAALSRKLSRWWLERPSQTSDIFEESKP